MRMYILKGLKLVMEPILLLFIFFMIYEHSCVTETWETRALYLSSNRRQTTWVHTRTSALLNRKSRDPNNPVDTVRHLCPSRRSSRLSSLSCRYKFLRRKLRDRYNSDWGNPLRAQIN